MTERAREQVTNAAALARAGDLFRWLERKMDLGCTDVTIFRGRELWSVEFRFAGVPRSEGGMRRFSGPTLYSALAIARMELK